jgi:hypothetical protein
MYSVFGYFLSWYIGGATITPKPQPASIIASASGRLDIKESPDNHKKNRVRKTNPKGIPPNAGSTKAFFTGLSLHNTFSSALKMQSNLDKKVDLQLAMRAQRIKMFQHRLGTVKRTNSEGPAPPQKKIQTYPFVFHTWKYYGENVSTRRNHPERTKQKPETNA